MKKTKLNTREAKQDQWKENDDCAECKTKDKQEKEREKNKKK